MQTESSSPSPDLAHLIKEFTCTTIQPAKLNTNNHIVIDDGCYDFVFFKGKGTTFSYGKECAIKIAETAFTVHQLEPPHTLRFDEEIHLFIAKVQPWANASFFPASMKLGLVNLNSLFTDEMDLVYNKIFEAGTFEEKKAVLETFLRSLNIQENDSFLTVSAICQKIYETDGAIKVNELVDVFKINRQVLNKRFKLHVHYTIKQFIRIVRIMTLIKYKISHHDMSLTTTAHHFNYSDQAHFNNDFKKVCGISPSIFFKNLPVFFQRHEK